MQDAHGVAPVGGDRIPVLTVGIPPARAILQADDDIAVVATADDVDDVPRILRRTSASVVLMRSVTDSAEELTDSLRSEHAHVAVVLWDAPFDAAVLLRAVEAGVRGYAPQTLTQDQLRRVIRAVAAGDPAIPRRLLGDMLDLLMRRRIIREEALRRLWRLTSRERAVLALLIEARSNEEMGGVLRISPQTVRKHVQHVLTKLGVHSRLEAVTFVHRHSLEEELHAA